MPNTIRIKRGVGEPPALSLVQGELAVDTDDGSIYTKLDDGTVSLVAGKSSRLEIAVRNQTGATIPAGAAVYITGAGSNRPLVSLAQANSETTSSKTLGLTTKAIATGHNGYVVLFGTLDKINTTAYTAGQALWLSATTAGGLTTTMPIAPNHAVFIGIVITSANNGKIEVRVANGYELEELHNVLITSVEDGNLLAYDSSTGLWKNKTPYLLGLATIASLNDYVLQTDSRINALSTDFIPQNTQSTATVPFSYYDSINEYSVDMEIAFKSPYGNYSGFTVTLTDSQSVGYVSIVGNAVTLGCGASNMTDALNALATGVDGWVLEVISGTGSSGEPSSVFEGLMAVVLTPAVSPETDNTVKFLLREGLFPEIARLAEVANATNSFVSVNSAGVVGFTEDTYADQSQLAAFAQLTGANFTGKLTVSASIYDSAAAQFDQTGFGDCVVIRSTSPASSGHCLRIENRGLGSSLLVEDSITPDTSAFIVNNNGVVGIQRPTGWTPAAGVFLDVGGKGVFTTTATTAPINISPQAVQPTTTVSGDVWMGNYNIFYRDLAGTHRTIPALNTVNQFSAGQAISVNSASNALRINQLGTGPALVVEDSTNPDTTAFVVDASGNVGIGVPSTFTGTEKLEVQGNIKFSDNTVQSTAFTTAQLPTGATATEARLSTNSTKFLTPETAHWMMMNPNIIQIQRAGFTITNTGTISFATAGWISSTTRTGTAGACSSRWRTFGLSQVDQVWSLTEKTSPASHLNFSNASHCSGRSLLQGITDAVMSWGFYHGKQEADGVGVLTRRGYGWRATGGAGSRFLSLEVHDGTTLTSVTSSYAIVDGHAFDWDLISNGAGTVTLYVNGTQVATSTAGPTGLVNLTPVIWQEEVETSAAAGSAFNGMVHSRGRFICFDS
jgi:hypothetical protein